MKAGLVINMILQRPQVELTSGLEQVCFSLETSAIYF
jgi:hypothetical protein